MCSYLMPIPATNRQDKGGRQSSCENMKTNELLWCQEYKLLLAVLMSLFQCFSAWGREVLTAP